MDRCFCKVSGSRAYSKAAVVGICHSCGDHCVFVWQLVYSTDSAVQACRVHRSAGANAIGRIPGVSPLLKNLVSAWILKFQHHRNFTVVAVHP